MAQVTKADSCDRNHICVCSLKYNENSVVMQYYKQVVCILRDWTFC